MADRPRVTEDVDTVASKWRAPYVVRLDGFEGPLGLLLHLIERRELDVTTISLALVADQYLACIRTAEGIDPDLLVEFIDVGAKLLLIKSVALLPAPEIAGKFAQAEIDDPTDLTERLRLYEAVRGVADDLRVREESDLHSFARSVPPPTPPATLAPGMHAPGDLTVALRRVLERILRTVPEQEIPRSEISVPDRIQYLRRELSSGARSSFFGLLRGGSRALVVATFLAVLELLRLGELRAEQSERFDDVTLSAATSMHSSNETGPSV
ncbi:MAG TPA: segregation/condensation protein A [Chloroflexota bacterium]|nr:segregation/condensation protein A [Chloroflexota bacterium]